MIPDPALDLTRVQAARWQLTKLAAALVRDGIPAATVMLDAREGCELASRARRAPARDVSSGALTPTQLEAVRAVVDYNWADEVRDYENCDDETRATHMLHHLRVLARLAGEAEVDE